MIRKVDYFAMQVPNHAGEAHTMLAHLRKARVNLLAFTGFPNGRGSQMDFVPANSAAFRQAAKAEINVTAVDGVAAGAKRFGAILWVGSEDVARASKTLKARR